MSGPGRDVLERAFPAPADAFERLTTARKQRQRDRRIADGAVAIVLVGALVAALVGAVLRREHHVPAAPITPQNVGQLGLAWWGPTVSAGSQPVVAGDRVYVLADDGTLSAFPTTCAGDRCDAIWTAHAGIDTPTSTAWGSPVVDGGRVYQPTVDGELIGYPTSCDETPCAPDWVGRTSGDLSTATPVVAGGYVFVGAGDCCHGSETYGSLVAFDEACASYPDPCRPAWTARLPGGFMGGQPVIAGDRLYVGSHDGTVAAFPIDCPLRSDGCEPIWTARTHGPIPNPKITFTPASRIVAPLVVVGSTLYVASGAWVYAFPTACDAFPCAPSWIGHTRGYLQSVAVSSDRVYASQSRLVADSHPGFSPRTVVFPTECQFRCPAERTFAGARSDPFVSDGVVYMLGTERVETGRPAAYDDACGSKGSVCAPLWTMSLDNGTANNFVTVADGSLYMSGTDGNLHVFQLGGTATCCSPASTSEAAPNVGYPVFYGAVLVGIAWIVVRRRSRARA
jgi:outer membrane protein assembly factor BamB